jgi:hypothetical protein
LVFPIGFLLICFAVLEIAVRILTRHDGDGSISFGARIVLNPQRVDFPAAANWGNSRFGNTAGQIKLSRCWFWKVVAARHRLE